MSEIRSVLERQRQLDVLSALMFVSLVAAVMLLGYALVARVDSTEILLLQDTPARTLVLCLLLTFLLYFVMEKGRLRTALAARDEALSIAKEELEASVERLSFAHQVAEVMISQPHEQAVPSVLQDLAGRIHADAAALLAEEMRVWADGAEMKEQAEHAILPVATQCVGARQPLAVCADGESSTIAVPLRVHGKLRYVLAAWRAAEAFDAAQLEALILVARIMELAMENEALAVEAAQRLERTVRTILKLLKASGSDRACAVRVARLALRLSDDISLPDGEREALRVAAALHDVVGGLGSAVADGTGEDAFHLDVLAPQPSLTHVSRLS